MDELSDVWTKLFEACERTDPIGATLSPCLTPHVCLRLHNLWTTFVRVVYVPFARGRKGTNALLRARVHQEGQNVCRHPQRNPDLDRAGAG